MVVFLFVIIYLISHLCTFYIYKKCNFMGGPNAAIYLLSCYVSQLIIPLFILLLSLILSGVAHNLFVARIAEYLTACLGLILFTTINVMIFSVKSKKTS